MAPARIYPRSPDTGHLLASLERTATSCTLDSQIDWTLWLKYLWLQHEELSAQDVMKKFAARLAPAVS